MYLNYFVMGTSLFLHSMYSVQLLNVFFLDFIYTFFTLSIGQSAVLLLEHQQFRCILCATTVKSILL